MYLKYPDDFPFINGYMYFRSTWSKNIFAQTLICRKCFELNIKLLNIRMRAKKVVITFVAIVFFVKFSWNIFTAFIPLKFRMHSVHSPFLLGGVEPPTKFSKKGWKRGGWEDLNF